MRCKHGIEESWCAGCSGLTEELKQQRLALIQKRQEKLEERRIIRRKYYDLKKLGKLTENFGQPYTDKQIAEILSIQRPFEKYLLAVKFKRTIGAINWVYNYGYCKTLNQETKENGLYFQVQKVKHHILTGEEPDKRS